MLRTLSGKITEILDNSVIIDVNGLGFEVICSRSVLENCNLNENMKLVTNLQFSETGAVIYGFMSEREREFFLKLTSVKGIGGKTAISILSELSIEEVINAVSTADFSAFSRVPGIGKKTAERLCFKLKNLSSFKNTEVNTKKHVENSSVNSVVSSIMEALLSLGFSQADAAGTINMIRAAQGENFNKLDEENLLRLALRELHK